MSLLDVFAKAQADYQQSRDHLAETARNAFKINLARNLAFIMPSEAINEVLTGTIIQNPHSLDCALDYDQWRFACTRGNGIDLAIIVDPAAYEDVSCPFNGELGSRVVTNQETLGRAVTELLAVYNTFIERVANERKEHALASKAPAWVQRGLDELQSAIDHIKAYGFDTAPYDYQKYILFAAQPDYDPEG